MQFETKYITKKLPIKVNAVEYYDVPYDVQVQKRVPYEVEVNEPVVEFKDEVEKYSVKVPKQKTITYTVTETIPVVTRQCTDSHGKLLKNMSDLPLIASGPTKAQLNLGNEDPYEN